MTERARASLFIGEKELSSRVRIYTEQSTRMLNARVDGYKTTGDDVQ